MLVKIIGQNTKKEYVRGTRDYCLRLLQKQYPSQTVQNIAGHRTYPEPLIIKTIKVNGHA